MHDKTVAVLQILNVKGKRKIQERWGKKSLQYKVCICLRTQM